MAECFPGSSHQQAGNHQSLRREAMKLVWRRDSSNGCQDDATPAGIDLGRGPPPARYPWGPGCVAQSLERHHQQQNRISSSSDDDSTSTEEKKQMKMKSNPPGPFISPGMN
ncbi:hypothetical protein GE061_007260 [Apolygus lucorum]|uniref:Uncharacterized protein n=1 Tax=Apolygus lucorum TaxID=248454 RepID=A0A8S9WV62_APOLU|nr:hypothetical protein GE061_007260 [Apolygus lucorum]